MNHAKVLLFLLALVGCAARAATSLDLELLERSSDQDLAAVLIKTDAQNQIAILTLLTQRYRLPSGLLINPGIYPPQQAHPTIWPVPSAVVSSTFGIVSNEWNDVKLRLAGLHLLKLLLLRTNITEVFEGLLPNPDRQVRLEAACALIQYTTTRHQTINQGAIDTLNGILQSDATAGQLCEALEWLSKTGDKGTNSAPEVLRLTKDRSKEVRAAARAALRAMKGVKL
jgi:hypothetical protein